MHVRLPRGFHAETEIEIKRSRFITTLARVDDEDAARAVIAEVRDRYPDARHHCSAFIVDVPDAQPIERSSDDGEPSGTAGMPMLDVLRGAEISQVVAVVTRYFGGILLGTGGLVRAYAGAVTDALDAAPRVQPVVRDLYRVELDHADAGRVQADLINRGVDVIQARYGASVELTIATGLDSAELDLPSLVAQLTAGEVEARPAGTTLIEEPC